MRQIGETADALVENLRLNRASGISVPEVQWEHANAWTRLAHNLAAMAARSPGPGEYRINTAFLDADPYLASHTFDIDSLLPSPVPDPEVTAIFNVLKATGLGGQYVLDGVQATIDGAAPLIKTRLRKRVGRQPIDACRHDRDQGLHRRLAPWTRAHPWLSSQRILLFYIF